MTVQQLHWKTREVKGWGRASCEAPVNRARWGAQVCLTRWSLGCLACGLLSPPHSHMCWKQIMLSRICTLTGGRPFTAGKAGTAICKLCKATFIPSPAVTGSVSSPPFGGVVDFQHYYGASFWFAFSGPGEQGSLAAGSAQLCSGDRRIRRWDRNGAVSRAHGKGHSREFVMASHSSVSTVSESITCRSLKLVALKLVLPLISRNKLIIFKQKRNTNFFSLMFGSYEVKTFACPFLDVVLLKMIIPSLWVKEAGFACWTIWPFQISLQNNKL